jgi:hypothetical protein
VSFWLNLFDKKKVEKKKERSGVRISKSRKKTKKGWPGFGVGNPIKKKAMCKKCTHCRRWKIL